jgi:predicted glycoside hydrolase/deacetylase ChbG (UPF0249 family)
MKQMSQKRLLIINADDVGYCEERNDGIFKCMLENVVTDATVLVNIDIECLNHFKNLINHQFTDDPNGKDSFISRLGLHLNLTEGKPIITNPIETISTLVDNNGMFFGKFGFSKQMISGKIESKQIELEIISQISLFFQIFGSYPSHLDGHNHAHVVPGVAEIISKVMLHFGIRKTRLPFEPILDEIRGKWMKDASNRDFLLEVCRWSELSKPIFQGNSIRFNDYFIGLSLMSENNRIEYISEVLSTLPYGENNNNNSNLGNNTEHLVVTEWMVHPGLKQQKNSLKYGDDFSRSEYRRQEMNNLFSKEFTDLLRKENIELINWKNI